MGIQSGAGEEFRQEAEVTQQHHQDDVLWLHLGPADIHDGYQVPTTRVCGDESIPARGEEKCHQGDGEEDEGVQGTEAGVGGEQEDNQAAGGDKEGGSGEDHPDQFLQVTCRNKDQQGSWRNILLCSCGETLPLLCNKLSSSWKFN